MKHRTKLLLERMSKALAALALASVLMPTVALGEPAQDTVPAPEARQTKGYLSVDKQGYREPGDSTELVAQATETYPSYYRSDEQPWAAGIRVKDQGSTGMCWAFSTTTAAEYSWAKESYERTGVIQEMSPAHLAYFLYNRVNDPLGNTAGDENPIPAGEDPWPLYGGNELYAMQHFATYSGIGLESKTPLSMVEDHIDHDTWDGTYPLFDSALAYDDYVTLEGSICYSTVGDELDTAINVGKHLVTTYGAISAGIDFEYLEYTEERIVSGQTYEYGHSFYNYTGSANHDHAVDIIGWDDNYPASNFTHETDAYGEPLYVYTDTGYKQLSIDEAREITTPPGNGAWIAQNSWGTECHDNGILYISYYSADSYIDGTFHAFDLQPADTYEYNFQYDGTADCKDAFDDGNENFRTYKGSRVANIFTNTTGRPITLDAVGFTSYNYGETHYDISVYSCLTDASDPTSGMLLGTTHVTSYDMGFKTAVLDEPIVIGPQERYAIVFSLPSDKTYFGVESQASNFSVPRTNPGQSFIRSASSNAWVDMHSYGACWRIKGLANGIDTNTARYTVSFVDGFGNVLNTQKVAHGRAAIAPADPVRKGYLFDGWDVDFSRVTSNLLVTATWVPAPAATWERLAGNGRYDTMASIVETGFKSSSWVVLATGANFPDALMASSLAGLKNCPVILTDGSREYLLEQAYHPIHDLGATYAYVVGGTGVISEEIVEELESMGVSVTRVAGSNRQATSVKALGELASASPDTVVIATGWSFADALSIGPWCYRQKAPILLAKNGRLSDEQVAAVQAVRSIKNVVIVGGRAAVSDEVMDQLGYAYNYERLSGSNRYETSTAIAEWEMDNYGMGLTNVAVTTGTKYPDALAGSALCGKNGSALLLVAPGEKNTAPVLRLLENHPNEVRLGYVLGGNGAVPESLVDQLRDATS